MQIKSIILYSVLILNNYYAYGQTTPEDVASHFFSIYGKDSVDKAIDYLFSTNKYSGDSKEGISNLKEGLIKIEPQIGKFLAYELLAKTYAGHDLVLLTFIVKHEKFPLTFRMLFYKSSNQWQVQNFKFDDKIDEELEESSKIYKMAEPIN